MLEVNGELHISFLVHSSLAQYKEVRRPDFTRATINSIPCQHCGHFMWNVLVLSSRKPVPKAPIEPLATTVKDWKARTSLDTARSNFLQV